MKTFLFILITIIARPVYCQKAEVIINARLIRSFDSVDYNKNRQHFYDIKLSIINRSEAPISFWLMSCSWWDNFMINNDYIYYYNNGCDANAPHLNTIKPNDSLNLQTLVIKVESTRYQLISTTKFGLIYIGTNKCLTWDCYHEIMGDKSAYDRIIWSNALNLRK